MKLIEYLVNNVLILLTNRIHPRRLKCGVRLERNWHSFFLRDIHSDTLILPNLRKFLRHESNLINNIRSAIHSDFISHDMLEARIDPRDSRYPWFRSGGHSYYSDESGGGCQKSSSEVGLPGLHIPGSKRCFTCFHKKGFILLVLEQCSQSRLTWNPNRCCSDVIYLNHRYNEVSDVCKNVTSRPKILWAVRLKQEIPIFRNNSLVDDENLRNST